MKKIEINDKTKKIIAWIMLIIMGIFSAIGILTCLGGIYSCVTKEKAEVKKVYAATETQAVTYQIPNITYLSEDGYYSYTTLYTLEITFTNTISLNFTNKGTGSTSQLNAIKIESFNYNETNKSYSWLISGLQYTEMEVGAPQPTQNQITEFTRITIKSNNFKNTGLNQITIEDLPTLCNQNSQLNSFHFITKTTTTYDLIISQDQLLTNTTWGASNYINSLEVEQGTAYQVGYDKGYNDGNANKEAYGQAQKEVGKQEGIAQANDYSFTSLISAVFDVPIQTLFGMLNFNILGVNVLTFITSILSIMLLVFIIKLILGG